MWWALQWWCRVSAVCCLGLLWCCRWGWVACKATMWWALQWWCRVSAVCCLGLLWCCRWGWAAWWALGDHVVVVTEGYSAGAAEKLGPS